MTRPLIEVLTFEGCPNAEPALELVARVVSDLGVGARVRCVDVSDLEVAATKRFLGSPTIRVNGRDVEPGAAERVGSTPACRVYQTESGLRGLPDERWLREALQASA